MSSEENGLVRARNRVRNPLPNLHELLTLPSNHARTHTLVLFPVPKMKQLELGLAVGGFIAVAAAGIMMHRGRSSSHRELLARRAAEPQTLEATSGQREMEEHDCEEEEEGTEEDKKHKPANQGGPGANEDDQDNPPSPPPSPSVATVAPMDVQGADADAKDYAPPLLSLSPAPASVVFGACLLRAAGNKATDCAVKLVTIVVKADDNDVGDDAFEQKRGKAEQLLLHTPVAGL